MTRIYTYGKQTLRSAEVTEQDVEDFIETHTKIINTDTVDKSVSVTLKETLPSVYANHDKLVLRVTDTSVSIGYNSHDGWCSINDYNRNTGEWHRDIFSKTAFIDPAIKYINISHTYDTDREFATAEFMGSDGQEWLQMKK